MRRTIAITFGTILTLLCMAPSVAQNAQPSQPTVKAASPEAAAQPELTVTESIALQSLVQRFQEAQRLLEQIKADIAHNHPGYHLDDRSLKLAKDEVQAKPAASVPTTPTTNKK